MTSYRFLLAGGGTSGHIYPALAVARQIKQDHPEAELLFCGTQAGLESRLIPEAGFAFKEISARGLPTRPSWDMIKALKAYQQGKKQCISIMKDYKPHAVIGTGGYVCGPVAAAAAALKIPLLIHEQNAYPGRANRMMARRSQVVCISFQEAAGWFKTEAPVILTGNPVRAEFFHQSYDAARAALGWPAGQPVILALGGSLGARSINEAVLGMAPFFEHLIQDHQDRATVPHVHLSCGKNHYERIAHDAGNCDWLTVYPYIDQVHLMMAAADLIVCRAGAGACFELAAVGRPSILIPYPYAAGDHQTANARALVESGAALLCQDDQLDAVWLYHQTQTLLAQEEKREQMGLAALNLASPDAAADICRQLYRIMKTE